MTGRIEAVVLKEFADVFRKVGIDEGRVDVREDGWYCIAVDPANVVMAEVLLHQEAWESYDFEPGTIGIDFEKVSKYCADFKKGEVIDITLSDTKEMEATLQLDGYLKRTFTLLDPEALRRTPKMPELEYETKIELHEPQIDMLKKVVGRKEEGGEAIVVGVTELRGEPVFCALFAEKNRRDCVPLEYVSSIYALKATVGTYSQELIINILSLLKKAVVATGTVTFEFAYSYPLRVKYQYAGIDVMIILAPRIVEEVDTEAKKREAELKLITKLRDVIKEPEEEPEYKEIKKEWYFIRTARKGLPPFKKKEYGFNELLVDLKDEVAPEERESILTALKFDLVELEEYYVDRWDRKPAKVVELSREPADIPPILTIFGCYNLLLGDEEEGLKYYYDHPEEANRVCEEEVRSKEAFKSRWKLQKGTALVIFYNNKWRYMGDYPSLQNAIQLKKIYDYYAPKIEGAYGIEKDEDIYHATILTDTEPSKEVEEELARDRIRTWSWGDMGSFLSRRDIKPRKQLEELPIEEVIEEPEVKKEKVPEHETLVEEERVVSGIEAMEFGDLPRDSETEGVGKNRGVRYRRGEVAAVDEEGLEYLYSVQIDSRGDKKVKKLYITDRQKKELQLQRLEEIPSDVLEIVDYYWPDLNLVQKQILGAAISNMEFDKGSLSVVLDNWSIKKKFLELFPNVSSFDEAVAALRELRSIGIKGVREESPFTYEDLTQLYPMDTLEPMLVKFGYNEENLQKFVDDIRKKYEKKKGKPITEEVVRPIAEYAFSKAKEEEASQQNARILEILKSKIQAIPEIHSAYLFGSYARYLHAKPNKWRPTSDIDINIIQTPGTHTKTRFWFNETIGDIMGHKIDSGVSHPTEIKFTLEIFEKDKVKHAPIIMLKEGIAEPLKGEEKKAVEEKVPEAVEKPSDTFVEYQKILQDKFGIDINQFRDKLTGGRADEKDITKYDIDQIVMGIEVEKEHTDDLMTALEISLDHLEEIPDYYTRLREMEEKATKEVPETPQETIARVMKFKSYTGSRPDWQFLLQKAVNDVDMLKADRYDLMRASGKLLGYNLTPEPSNVGLDRWLAQQLANETGKSVLIIGGAVTIEPKEKEKPPLEKVPMKKPKKTLKDVIFFPSVIIIAGKRRSGKTATGYRLLEIAPTKKKYVLGMPEGAWHYLPDSITPLPLTASVLEDLPMDAVFLIDEASLSFYAKKNRTELSTIMDKLILMSAQRGQTLIFVSHNLRKLNVNIILDSDILIFKEPSPLQTKYERGELKPMVMDAKKAFDGVVPELRTHYAYIFSDAYTGMIETPLPSFWSEELSFVWRKYADRAEMEELVDTTIEAKITKVAREAPVVERRREYVAPTVKPERVRSITEISAGVWPVSEIWDTGSNKDRAVWLALAGIEDENVIMVYHRYNWVGLTEDLKRKLEGLNDRGRMAK